MNANQNEQNALSTVLHHGYGFVGFVVGEDGLLNCNVAKLVLKRDDGEAIQAFRDRVAGTVKPGDEVELAVRHHRIDIATICRIV